MAKTHRKDQARMTARRSTWDRDYGGRSGFKRPGSNKKDYPAGRGKAHAPKN